MNKIAENLRTPIEVALALDENGMTTASAVYNFLELDPAHFARWCKTNILENDYAEENVDFEAFTINGEWGGQKKTDYYLTATFAKKLCMASHSEKGEEARKYFLGCETGVVLAVKMFAAEKQEMMDILEQSKQKIQLLETKIEELTEKQLLLGSNIDEIRSGSLGYKPGDWHKKIVKKVSYLAEANNKEFKDILREAIRDLDISDELQYARQRMLHDFDIPEPSKIGPLEVIDYDPGLKRRFTDYINSMFLDPDEETQYYDPMDEFLGAVIRAEDLL